MKKTFIYLSVSLLFATAFFSCTKSDSSPSTTSSGASFTLRGYNYIVPAGTAYTSFQVSNGLAILASAGLTSDGKAKALVYIGFYGTSRPTAGTYSIVGTTPAAAGQVAISALDSVSVSKEGIFNSTGTDKVSATVTVDASGKLTVTLPTTQMSGSNTDNTNPNNTVNTNITSTISGTFKEQ